MTPSFESSLKDTDIQWITYGLLRNNWKNLYKELLTSEQAILIVFIYLNVNDANIKIVTFGGA